MTDLLGPKREKRRPGSGTEAPRRAPRSSREVKRGSNSSFSSSIKNEISQIRNETRPLSFPGHGEVGGW